MKRIIALICVLAIMMPTAFAQNIKVVINGAQVKLDTSAQIQNGTVMLPVRELLERVGVMAVMGEYDRRATMKQGYIATVNDVEMIVPPNSDEAYYDQIWFELDTPTVAVENDVLVPLDFIQKLYGVEARQDNNTVRISAKIVNTKSALDMSKGELQALIESLPAGEVVAEPEDLLESKVYTGLGSGFMEKNIIEISDGLGFTQAVEGVNLTEPGETYAAQLLIPTISGIEVGDFLVMSFYARKIDTVDESGMGKMMTQMEETESGAYRKILTTDVIELNEKWEKYYFPVISQYKCSPGAARITFRIGYKPQTLQFADLNVINYGNAVDAGDVDTKASTSTYYGRQEGALWREEALKRIEKYRVRDINVRVVDQNGSPVPGAKVNANMTRSEFLWGTISQSSYGNKTGIRQDEITTKYFNAYTSENAMKPSAYGNGSVAVDHANFTIQNNLYYHGHTLLWDGLYRFPADLKEAAPSMNEQQLREYFYRYASEVMSYFSDSLVQMDVLNEPRANKYLRDRFGVDFIADFFRLSKFLRDEYSPDMKLYLNETGINGSDSTTPSVYKLDELIRELQAEGAVIDGIGHQVHTNPTIYPQALYNHMDYSSELVDEITVTEYDAVLAGGTADEQTLELEGDYLRDMIITAYSHPKMAGFIMWGFHDSQHWRGNSPMLTRQFTEKKAVQYWRQYVMDEWKTNADSVTDESGVAAMRGHRGEYEITVKIGGKTAKATLKVTDKGENTVTATVGASGIELASSDPVVKKEIPLKSYLELDYNREKYRTAYMKYLENCITDVATNDGESKPVLLDGEKNSFWTSSGTDSFIVCELDKIYDQGTLTIDWYGDGVKHLYDIEVSADNVNWQPLEKGHGEGEQSFRIIGRQMKFIKIKSLVARGIAIDNISFSML